MIFQFTAPPLPHYIICGEDTYQVGDKHPDRYNIGVFDLILVTKGRFSWRRTVFAYRVRAGCYLILRPDATHRTFEPCQEETHFYWSHFQMLGSWIETEELTLLPYRKPICLMCRSSVSLLYTQVRSAVDRAGKTPVRANAEPSVIVFFRGTLETGAAA